MRYPSYGLVVFLLAFGWLIVPASASAALSIQNIQDNRTQYANQQIPEFEKLEISFQVANTQASNLQLPYISTVEAGSLIQHYAEQGISVDAVFTAPNGQTYHQPAFYFQNHLKAIRNNKDWYYPTESYSWKVRFSPDQTGTWHYKLTAKDKSGTIESASTSFTVTSSSSHGFLQVSQKDTRYFEFEDGTYFPALGHNIAMNSLRHEKLVQNLSQNDIRFFRAWLAPFGIYGTSWSHWRMMPGTYDGYLPRVPIINFSFSGEPHQMYYYVTMGSSWFQPCMFIGHEQPLPPVKPNTNYYGTVPFNVLDVTGPRVAGNPYGFTLKTGPWMTDCAEANTGTRLSDYQSNTNGFKTVNFLWNSGNNNFLPNFYLVLENASTGRVFIKNISLREMSGGTLQNPQLTSSEVFDKPNPQQHTYMAQRNSAIMDDVLELAEHYDLYLRLVIHEKNEHIFLKMDQSGIPAASDNVQNFYGNGRALTGTRWLQQAWWRYLQARWGYSPHIHSWELLNEGNPANAGHFTLADELGIYMKCRAFGITLPYQDATSCTYHHPNAHMVSTSFWHSFPVPSFWNNANYPNLDFADIHAYISTGYAPDRESIKMEGDAAYYHIWYSNHAQSRHLGMPVVRGEAGMDLHNRQNKDALNLQRDTQGIWLHNYLWAQLHPGGLIEQYWWWDHHIVQEGVFDHHLRFKLFANFLKTIPLTNGRYQDLTAAVSNANLRVVGQKDTTHSNAHLWIQNIHHTWKNVIDNINIPAQSGTIIISNLTPNRSHQVQWWDTYTGTISAIQNISTTSTGDLQLTIHDLTTDIAVKIYSGQTPVPPTLP
jgi:hypothetical protein